MSLTMPSVYLLPPVDRRIQEQQEEIEALKAQNAKLKTSVLEMTVSIMVYKNGLHMRDVRTIKNASELVIVINGIISSGGEIVAIEELDTDILDLYSKSLNDDDLDAMAEALEIPE